MKVMTILNNPDYKDPAKTQPLREEIRATMLKVADMDIMASLTLANFKRKFSPEEFQKFKDLFSKLLFTTYITRIEDHSKEKLSIIETRKIDETKVFVVTKTNPGDQKEVPVNFSMVHQGETWKVFDIEVEGVSLVKNYRSQFREILVNGTPADLLKRLEEKVKENEPKQ